jgi:glutathione S-transferase
MYTLYWAEGTASFGPQLILEESNIDHEIVKVDTTKGEHRTPDYLAVNPRGQVPSLVLPDGQVLSETAAIMLYLADAHHLDDLAPPVDHPLRGLFYRSLFLLSSGIQNDYKRFYYSDRFSSEAAHAPAIKAKAQEDLISGWRLVDADLAAGGPYHLGARFSLVDIYLVMLVTWYQPVEALFDECPAVRRCYDLVAARPAVKCCLAQQRKLSIGTS